MYSFNLFVHWEICGINILEVILIRQYKYVIGTNKQKTNTCMLKPVKKYQNAKKMPSNHQFKRVKVCHTSNLLYQGFAVKYVLGIYLHGKA